MENRYLGLDILNGLFKPHTKYISVTDCTSLLGTNKRYVRITERLLLGKCLLPLKSSPLISL